MMDNKNRPVLKNKTANYMLYPLSRSIPNKYSISASEGLDFDDLHRVSSAAASWITGNNDDRFTFMNAVAHCDISC